MENAIKQALECKKDVPVGCVIKKDGVIKKLMELKILHDLSNWQVFSHKKWK